MNNGLRHMRPSTGLIGLSMALALVSACSSNNNESFSSLPSPQINESVAPLPGASGEYLIQPGDRLSVNVLGQDQLSGEFPVQPNGTVNLPTVGEVPATGRSVTDLQNELLGRYSTSVSNPQIFISVLNTSQ